MGKTPCTDCVLLSVLHLECLHVFQHADDGASKGTDALCCWQPPRLPACCVQSCLPLTTSGAFCRASGITATEAALDSFTMSSQAWKRQGLAAGDGSAPLSAAHMLLRPNVALEQVDYVLCEMSWTVQSDGSCEVTVLVLHVAQAVTHASYSIFKDLH